MQEFQSWSREALAAKKAELIQRYEGYCQKGLNLDMSRGKPGPEQLDISLPILDIVTEKQGYIAENGLDCRNYGGLEGIPECISLFAEILQADPARVLIGGNSSLTLMFDFIAQCMLTPEEAGGWRNGSSVKVLCPVPGYDRHFSICEYFGIEMVQIEMREDGPDLAQIREAIKDPAVKGMFCVPKYSNPQGITYSDAVVDEIAALAPAAKNFRIVWDNAYAVHDLTAQGDVLKNILEACEAAGNAEMAVVFSSSSKITFAGAGVSAVAAGPKTYEWLKKRMSIQTIGNDKLNQMRHALYFKNLAGVQAHMQKHAALIRPKFDAVSETFEREFNGYGIADWKEPNGGYFISLDVMDGCAKRAVALCQQAGVTLTPAGATFPQGNDPRDRNIRIAPTYPSVAELTAAAEVLAVSVQLAAVEKLLGES